MLFGIPLAILEGEAAARLIGLRETLLLSKIKFRLKWQSILTSNNYKNIVVSKRDLNALSYACGGSDNNNDNFRIEAERKFNELL